MAATEIGCEDCRKDRTIDVGEWLRVLSDGPCTVRVLPEEQQKRHHDRSFVTGKFVIRSGRVAILFVG